MTVNGPGEVERQKEVVEQMNELDGAVAQLSQNLESLEPRLEKVMRMKSEAKEKEGIPQKGLCTLAHEIRGFRFRIENMSANVREILSRLEL